MERRRGADERLPVSQEFYHVNYFPECNLSVSALSNDNVVLLRHFGLASQSMEGNKEEPGLVLLILGEVRAVCWGT